MGIWQTYLSFVLHFYAVVSCFYVNFIAAMHASLVSLLVKVDGGSQWNTFKYGVYTRRYKKSFRASNSPGFSSQFLYKAITNGIWLKESASLPRNYLVFKSLILFWRQVEKRCSQSTLIFLHAEKLLLTWHFLTRKGENKNREEKKKNKDSEGETWKDTKKIHHHVGSELPVNSPHFSLLWCVLSFEILPFQTHLSSLSSCLTHAQKIWVKMKTLTAPEPPLNFFWSTKQWGRKGRARVEGGKKNCIQSA